MQQALVRTEHQQPRWTTWRVLTWLGARRLAVTSYSFWSARVSDSGGSLLARTAATNCFMRAWSFFPGEVSRQLHASTAYGRTVVIPSLTFSGDSPPARKTRGNLFAASRAIDQSAVRPVPPRNLEWCASTIKASTVYCSNFEKSTCGPLRITFITNGLKAPCLISAQNSALSSP